MSIKPIYLDYAATTPVLPEVMASMEEALSFEACFGNPHSAHDYGTAAAEIVQGAQRDLADLLGAAPNEIIYTSGATEANNLALQGAAYFYQQRGKHIISVKTEHKAVLEVLQFLERQGFSVTYLPVDSEGLIALQDLEQALRPDTILTSVMLVNNETGVIQPIAAIAEILKAKGVLLHVDAAQALGKIPVKVSELKAGLISFSGHKIYGPKGIGALYVQTKPKIHLRPLMYGGGQQQGLRPGTQAPFLVQGLTQAAKTVIQDLAEESTRILTLKERLWEGLSALSPNIQLNSPFSHSVAQICNVTFKGMDGEMLMNEIQNTLAVAQGSACNSTHIEPSHVLRAMGIKQQDAHSSIRFSFGRYTTLADIDAVIKVFRAFYLHV